MSTMTLNQAMIDELTQILAVPDPKPSEPWKYRIASQKPSAKRDGMLQSIGQLRDLLASLADEAFIIVSKPSQPGVFTQALRTGSRFATECSIPNEMGNLLHQYHDGDGNLPLELAHLVMGAYIMRGGRLPLDWQGKPPATMQY